MATVAAEQWACSECGGEVNGEILFAWCDGCAKVLCVTCLGQATICEVCDTIVCRDCATKFFQVACAACGFALHGDCVQRQKHDVEHPLCASCCRSAASLWA